MAGFRAELKRLRHTCIWSWQGWRAAWVDEVSLRHWVRLQVASVLLALLVPLSPGERALIVALGFLVIAAELFNSAIEVIVDMISPDPHPMAGRAKDIGSAAVAVTAIGTGIAWAIILLG